VSPVTGFTPWLRRSRSELSVLLSTSMEAAAQMDLFGEAAE